MAPKGVLQKQSQMCLYVTILFFCNKKQTFFSEAFHFHKEHTFQVFEKKTKKIQRPILPPKSNYL